MTRTERQNLGIDRWRDSGGRGSLVWPTGCGKTRGALAAIDRVTSRNPNLIIRVIVPTKVLQDQWEEKIEEQQWDLDVRVLVLNTAAKYPFNCDFLVLDEIHKCAAEQMAKVFTNCRPKLILGLTATYERLDGREKIILDKYCPVCDTITIQEATRNGWLSLYREYKVYLDVDLTEYNKANKEFLQHFAFFDFDFDTAMKCATNVFAQQKLAKQMGCDLKEVKAHAFGFIRALKARKQFVANHPKKLEIAKKILAARPNAKAITFNSSIANCGKYGFGYVLHSQKSKKDNKAVLEEFAKCQSGVLHTSKMADEGLDVPGLSLGIMLGYSSSKTSHIQRVGRVIRFEPGKVAEFFVLVIKNTVEDNWIKKASENMNYIEINEAELDDVLYNSIDKPVKIQDKFTNDLLRK